MFNLRKLSSDKDLLKLLRALQIASNISRRAINATRKRVRSFQFLSFRAAPHKSNITQRNERERRAVPFQYISSGAQIRERMDLKDTGDLEPNRTEPSGCAAAVLY